MWLSWSQACHQIKRALTDQIMVDCRNDPWSKTDHILYSYIQNPDPRFKLSDSDTRLPNQIPGLKEPLAVANEIQWHYTVCLWAQSETDKLCAYFTSSSQAAKKLRAPICDPKKTQCRLTGQDENLVGGRGAWQWRQYHLLSGQPELF